MFFFLLQFHRHRLSPVERTILSITEIVIIERQEFTVVSLLDRSYFFHVESEPTNRIVTVPIFSSILKISTLPIRKVIEIDSMSHVISSSNNPT